MCVDGEEVPIMGCCTEVMSSKLEVGLWYRRM
jgi:hypothetical protein